ncbi:LacI family DNA-binding transcriptional regulator [Paucibacter sp. R3-3]|uniref:LacI family DNA-binding transcriptional regulator n=1 Tax=Roseateles agri TaxID=3098619 RepID=A0ABU5DHR3_9BURK|nr:LacI family DNA-binding transcriptional regulator [Paucibacter sp. R3-3]MDY0745260.1 LacI family DNA-binding transcriptional regulator [Paucibacter sp. R3-3]
MATLSDVARLAGVTTATVSNVLRNPGKVKPSTVEKVEAAIASTGYRPNLMARALAEGKSSMVAMVLPDITNPFYPEFVAVAERVARDRNYFLMVCNTPDRPDIGLAYLKQITGTLAGGVLVLDTGILPGDIEQISNRRAPIVLASNEAIHYDEQVPHVVLDLHRAGEIAGQHLVELGHREVGAIVGCGLAGRQIVRLGGFESALQAAGLSLAPEHVRDTPDTVEGGRAAAESLLAANANITAIFATNDLMAYGAAQVLAERGIAVPQAMSLIGITDIHLARDMRPALTTVALHTETMATLAINLLLDLIEDPGHQPRSVKVPEPALVVRASTGVVAAI